MGGTHSCVHGISGEYFGGEYQNKWDKSNLKPAISEKWGEKKVILLRIQLGTNQPTNQWH